MKRSLIASALFALIIPLSANAISIDEIRAQIQSLLIQIEQLKQQLATLPAETPVACTMDAKICPDGTAVGRTGPRCEFAPCPGGGGSQDNTPPRWCIKYANLEFGARGADVTALQAAIGEADLGSTPTGYYGKLTRDVWARHCKDYRDYRNGDSLAITGITGPTTLADKTAGVWTIQVSTTSASTLTYYVVWGDEDAFSQILTLGHVYEAATSSSPTFTHTYARSGRFTAHFGVRDADGRNVRKPLIITVGQVKDTDNDTEVSTQCRRWTSGTNIYARDYAGGSPYIIGAVEVNDSVSQAVCREYFTTSGGGMPCTNVSDTGYCSGPSTGTHPETTGSGAKCILNGTSYAEGSKIQTCTVADNGKTCVGPLSGGTNINVVSMLCTNGRWTQQ